MYPLKYLKATQSLNEMIIFTHLLVTVNTPGFHILTLILINLNI